MTLCTCSGAGTNRVTKGPLCSQPKNTSLVPIEAEPMIGETPQETLQSWLTPNPLFYVRNHYSFPSTEQTASWSLSIDGNVCKELEFTLENFRQFPRQTLPVTTECAGNNRSDLQPKVPGNPFQNGAVSTAIWGGIPLHCLLDKAGIKDGAVEVLFEGLDTGSPVPEREVEPYLRSLPMDVAMHPHTLLAFEMNGEPLPREHGYPIRLIVPGWYGMASVKWLSRISVLQEKFQGFFQSDRYVFEEDDEIVPVSSIYTKSLISWPQQNTELPLQAHNINGLAWSGNRHIKKVEFSVDDGQVWSEAELVGPRYRYAWQQWNFFWEPKEAGHYTLVARAEDEEGNMQPMETKWNRLGYAINGVRPVCVQVT